MNQQHNNDKDNSTTNRPRNHFVLDATQPYTYTYYQYGKVQSITIRQTPDEETWPGGALWDIGVLLSHIFVGLGTGCKKNTNNTEISKLPLRMYDAMSNISLLDNTTTILELGCGVGLTSLVAASVLGTKLCIMTDLDVVVEKVAYPNLLQNSTTTTTIKKEEGNTTNNVLTGKRGRVIAMPLCWGNVDDEDAVERVFENFVSNKKSNNNTKKKKKKKKKQQGTSSSPQQQEDNDNNTSDTNNNNSKPDIILVGDVAYQHKPGAPSHFDALISTVIRFMGSNTLIIFGTRMRMPASKDLLDLFCENFEQICLPPIQADELEPTLISKNKKHQITIHVFAAKKEK